MCGIYGSTIPYDNQTLEKKVQHLRHRGPDFQQISRYEMKDGKVIVLGHTRLAIIDLNARSSQPFVYNDWIQIVFNGEIYNYKTLKNNYLNQVQFKTTSDTEVLCAMYEKFGTRCVDYFNGMFAFVILDKRRNILFGARDRLGKKPFYYHWDSNGFEFASQPESIHIGNTFTIDSESRQFYLVKGYIPEPYCIWKEIKKLCAGQYIVYHLHNNQLEISTYWDLFSNSCGFTRPKSYAEAKETVKELLDDAVKLRLQADVPIGMFLSGGIDSTLTSALVARDNGNIRAYTIAFDEVGYDESSYAKATAEYLNIPLTTLRCSNQDVKNILDGYPIYFDEPFADTAAIPTSILAQRIREEAPVAIGGDGGDELFLGYNRYRYFQRKALLFKLIPPYIRKGIYETLHHTTHLSKFNFLGEKSATHRIVQIIRYGNFGTAWKDNTNEICDKLPYVNYADNRARGVLAASDFEMKDFLNACGNTKSDRSCMRYGLELRCPLMDYRLAEYSRLLPFQYLWSKELGGKRILKDILYEIVPRRFMERPKHGFWVPIGNWLREESIKQDLWDVVTLRHIKEFIPELDANRMMQYRDGFITSNRAQTLPDDSYFKIYIYLKWNKVYSL